jgi:Cys-tRNA(Pro)/Cys-tRNA(Cys) deacylase
MFPCRRPHRLRPDARDEHPTVFVSAGRRGLQVEVVPDDLISLTNATEADLSS